MSRVSALFVAPYGAVQASGGGVQVAVREYRKVLDCAGFDIEIIPFNARAALRSRVINRLVPRVMLVSEPQGLAATIDGRLRQTNAKFVFFCPNLFPLLSRGLRSAFPGVRQILLSVGVESIDFCVHQQIRENVGGAKAAFMLGRQLLEESEQRRLIDGVITLAPLEVEVERWLGAPRAFWAKRTVSREPLAAVPVDGRVGCVSTLNHPPNYDGIVRLLEKLEARVSPHFSFRLVGGPAADGEKIAQRFPFVAFRGGLDDAQLRDEASTWCCFAHPLFVYAKGCSTKLAVALGWELPIVTTECGVRGYEWNRDLAPLASTADEMADQVIEASRITNHAAGVARTRRILSQTPTIEQIAQEAREFLLDIAHEKRAAQPLPRLTPP
jgi:hypothetical protein